MMELTEDFIKMLQIAFLVIGTLAIFLIFISYNISVYVDEARREAVILLESLLTDDCLVVEENGKPVKALFSETKLTAAVSNPDCIGYDYGKIEIVVLDGSRQPWVITLGPSDKKVETESFSIAIDLDVDGIKPGKITVAL